MKLRQGWRWKMMLIFGLVTEWLASLAFSDVIQIIIGIGTLLLVVWFFEIEQRPNRRPLKLLGSDLGSYPPPEDPRKVRKIHLTGASQTFLLDVVPRVGGNCTEFSRHFQLKARWRDRIKDRNKVSPTAHYVPSEVIAIERIRIITKTNGEPGFHLVPSAGSKEVYIFDKPFMFTPGEPFHCEVTARLGKGIWNGEFSIRFTLPGVTRARVAVTVEARP